MATAVAPPQAAATSESDGQLVAQRDAPLGGQAVLEGVMMRGVSNWAVAVRKPVLDQSTVPPVSANGQVEIPAGENGHGPAEADEPWARSR